MKRISVIFGTRPEAIKMCPLVLLLKQSGNFEVSVCVTAQHREMLDQVLDVFGVVPDVDLALMRHNQSLGELTARAVKALDQYLAETKPDLALVQGDTTTVFCASLAAFYRGVSVGHVEAGLRTGDKLSPFPEEINRVLTSRLADYHFAPTKWSRDNLLREGVPESDVFVTGNTVIDALYIAVEQIRTNPPQVPGLAETVVSSDQPMILITGHRRESFGGGFESICKAIAKLSLKFPKTNFVYPVHRNPNVLEPVQRILSSLENVYLIEPLAYLPFVLMLDKAKIILTDSGGMQEEAPSLGKPVLVMRETTERPEAVEMGTVKLVGTDTDTIAQNVSTLLTDEKAYATMANAVNPYGDGKACHRIREILKKMAAGEK